MQVMKNDWTLRVQSKSSKFAPSPYAHSTLSSCSGAQWEIQTYGTRDSGKDNNKRNMYDKKNPKWPHPTNSHFQSSVITHIYLPYWFGRLFCKRLKSSQFEVPIPASLGDVILIHPKSVSLMGYELPEYRLLLFSFDYENPGVMM